MCMRDIETPRFRRSRSELACSSTEIDIPYIIIHIYIIDTNIIIVKLIGLVICCVRIIHKYSFMALFTYSTLGVSERLKPC